MELRKALYFSDSLAWRKWLEHNHLEKREAWLVHRKKDSDNIAISYDEAVEEALCFGWIDGKMKSIDHEKFILRYSPRKGKSIWSKLNREKAEKLIKADRMTSIGLAKIEEAKKNGYWDRAYTNGIKEEIPSDLKKALSSNMDAWRNFQNFANSYRNTYIYWINSAKTDVTRKRRITEVVKRSSINKKPGE